MKERISWHVSGIWKDLTRIYHMVHVVRIFRVLSRSWGFPPPICQLAQVLSIDWSLNPPRVERDRGAETINIKYIHEYAEEEKPKTEFSYVASTVGVVCQASFKMSFFSSILRPVHSSSPTRLAQSSESSQEAHSLFDSDVGSTSCDCTARGLCMADTWGEFTAG